MISFTQVHKRYPGGYQALKNVSFNIAEGEMVFVTVMLPLQICGFDYRESHKRVRAALDKVGLLKREKSSPIALSGGEQQRLCIARAIVNRPAILLADEPTGTPDAAYAQEIMAIFKSFHHVRVTLL